MSGDHKSKVAEAQGKIVDRLVECETAIAELYAAYADAFPDRKGFWQKLSAEERDHARLLQTMHKLLDKGHFLYDIGRFNHREIDSLLHRITAELDSVRQEPPPETSAATAALSIENSIIDAHFYDIVRRA